MLMGYGRLGRGSTKKTVLGIFGDYFTPTMVHPHVGSIKVP
jgi:hypothetical protein